MENIQADTHCEPSKENCDEIAKFRPLFIYYTGLEVLENLHRN